MPLLVFGLLLLLIIALVLISALAIVAGFAARLAARLALRIVTVAIIEGRVVGLLLPDPLAPALTGEDLLPDLFTFLHPLRHNGATVLLKDPPLR